MFDIGGAGARTLQIAAAPLPGEENTANNTLTRVVNVGSEPRRILYMEGEPRWEYKFIRQAEEDDRMVQIVSIDPHQREQDLPPGHLRSQRTGRRLPVPPGRPFRLPGIDHRIG